jgi:hypothetical protein
MVYATFPMIENLEEQIHQRTNRQVRNLSVELRAGRVVLRGQATSYYVKQLAQQEVIGTLPADVRVENTIIVAR